MRVPRRSLVLFVLAGSVHATKPACDLLLELRFDRPVAHVTPAGPPRALAVDLDALTLDPAAAQSARAALADLDPALVDRVLRAADRDEQRMAFRLLFDWADVAFAAREPRMTLTTLIGDAVFNAEAAGLFAAARAAISRVSTRHLRARAQTVFEDEGRTLTTALSDAAAAARLRFAGSSSHETIALDAATGAPDRFTFELARALEAKAAFVTLMPGPARDLAWRVVLAKRRALALAWGSPHFAALSRLRYTEPVANGYVDRPVRDFIANARYRHPYWWETFGKFAELEDLAAGRPPAPPARITGETSRSPLAYLFGRRAERVVYWPAVRDRGGIRPDLSRLAVNETLVDGRVEAVELLANEVAGQAPRGYLFLNYGDELVPAQRFNGLPLARACVRCHATALGSGRPAFMPFFLRSTEDLLKVGYRGEGVVRGMLNR